jgi:hypothetical protein
MNRSLVIFERTRSLGFVGVVVGGSLGESLIVVALPLETDPGSGDPPNPGSVAVSR